MRTIAAAALLVLFASAAGAELRVRLREHFDVSRIHWGDAGVDQTYYGATNTLNLWWERPGEWALGLAFMPVLTSGYRQVGTANPLVDDRVRLYNFGVEGKLHFPRDRLRDEAGDANAKGERAAGPFVRGGVFASHLEVEPSFGGSRWGGSYYVALGWEIPLFDGAIGLAPDLGFRHTILEGDTRVLSFSPSIAASLYFVSDWLMGWGGRR